MTAISTTQSGAPVTSDAHSKSVGADGAIILTDHYLVEKLAQFNRERVPERVVHAKGGGAFGTFKATEDVSRYTKAAFLQPGVETEMLIRFSSVAGENGSPDTWRDPRGFAVKFYTSEGNYDLVGNNTPVFFIRDGIKFPDFIHSQKRLPGTHLRDADMQWDFWTLSPESAHQVTWLMGDRGLPASWREMQGYGSHTYQWINAEGERFWVKYHFYIRDLSENIDAGNFPSWDLHVQVMPYEDAKTYRFNPFDLTKVWPHGDYPLIKVGTMELNKNPENYFAQIEQATFAPSNFVPGIAASPDKMLQARIFSYADAHRYRVGTNHAQIPVNQPKNQVNNYSQDGAGRYHFNAPSVPVYAPNTFGGPAALEPQDPAGGWENDGELTLAAHSLHAEDSDFVQAGALYREVYDEAAKARFLETITGAVGGVKRSDIKERAIQYWTNVDADLGAKLRANLGTADAPSAPVSDAESANKIG
jgi:catalase